MPIPKNRELSALRLYDFAAFKKRIADALTDNGGDADKTATALGVSRRTMFRWRSEANRATTDSKAEP
jgi:transposase-like protein